MEIDFTWNSLCKKNIKPWYLILEVTKKNPETLMQLLYKPVGVMVWTTFLAFHLASVFQKR